jgi:pimeloyl-ACP methyl ester carboxylesterase
VRLSLAIALLIAFIAATAAYSRLPGIRESGAFDVDPPTPYFRYSNGSKPSSRLLVLHGLGGNKDMLNLLCYGLADAGIEVFSVDLPGHGSSDERFDAVRARNVVANVLDKLGSGTDILAHSLGGALILDLANDQPIGNLVLFSPAPTPVERIQSPRILLFQGEFDLTQVRAFTPQVKAAATGPLEFHDVPRTGHTGALNDPRIIEQVSSWLGGDTRQMHTSRRRSLLLAMLVASLAFGIVLLESVKKSPAAVEPRPLESKTFLFYVAAAGIAAVVPLFIHIARWLHLFAADYLMGFVFLAGSVLCLAHARIHVARRPLLIGIGAAAFAIAIPGLLVLSESMQMNLSIARLWRFAAMAGLGLPLFVADEILLRPIRPRWKGVFAMLLTRILLGAIVVSASFMWGRDAGFLYLMMDSVVLFWIALWFVGGLVQWRTNDALSTASFMAIIQGWLFAALFVTT